MITFKKLLERAKTEKIAIHTPTDEQAVTLLSELDKNGFTWLGGGKLTTQTEYEYYKENTCYDFGMSNYPYMDKVAYSPLDWYQDDWYQDEGYTIIEFNDIDFKENK